EVLGAFDEVAHAGAPSAAEVGQRALARRWRALAGGVRRFARARVGVAVLLMLALFAVLAWFAFERGWLPGAARQLPTVAVLPFRNKTDDPEGTSYIADGLAEALATNLAQTDRLRVLPWV